MFFLADTFDSDGLELIAKPKKIKYTVTTSLKKEIGLNVVFKMSVRQGL